MGWSVFKFLISFVIVCGMECVSVGGELGGGSCMRVSRFVLLTSQHQLRSYRDGTFVNEITRETGGIRNRIDEPRFKRQAAYMLHC